MKRTTIVVIVAILAAVVAYGAYSAYNDKDTTGQVKQEMKIEKKTVANTAQKIGATNKSEAVFAMIGAKDGAKYDVGTTQVEIYEFNNDKLASGVDYLKDAGEVRKDGNVVVLVHGTAQEADAIAKKF